MSTSHVHESAVHDHTGPARTVPRKVTVAAWSVPILVLGEFALLAAVPVAVVVVAVLTNAGLRPLRWYAAALGVLYAVPLAAWVLDPDRAESLSKDIGPVPATLVVAAAVALAAKVHALGRTRRGRPAAG